jgi:hypothetical protein
MRRSIGLLVALTTLTAGPAGAQDAESLRRELGELRRQLDQMKDQYEKSIDTLTRRLQQIEAAPPAPTPTATPPPPGAPPATALQTPTAPSTPGLGDLARRREPFGLYQQRGPGQFLFDIGIAGDFVGNLTSRNVDKADAGTFAERENRVFPREVELLFFGQIDPYARGAVVIEAAEEAGGEEIGISLAEAHLTLLTLPYGTQAKLGLMRNRFGYANQLHAHDLPWIDRPNVLTNFLGDEGLVEKGVELTLVPPLPFYFEALAGIFNGDNEAAFGRGKLTHPLVTGRLRTFLELGDEHAIQLGISGAHGRTGDRLTNALVGADVKYKLRPDGWRHPLLTIGGEALYARRRVERLVDLDGDDVGDVGQKLTRKRFGWYGWGEVQPWRRWAFGARYDSSQLPVEPGREWAVGPYVSFWPSEFLRFRLGYKHTERSERIDPAGNGGSARRMDEIFIQGTFVLGAHPAHPF